eukprot:497234_1
MPRRRASSSESESESGSEDGLRPKQPYIRMAFEAIISTRHAGKGVSRAKIANYIKNNFDGIAEGAQFNSCLRRALYDGIDRGVLETGSTSQRFKITDLGRKEKKEKSLSKKFDVADERKKEKSRKA